MVAWWRLAVVFLVLTPLCVCALAIGGPSPVMGQPVEALIGLINEVEADLLIVGNRGLRGIGRLLCSVSADISRKSPVDVLIIHTT